MANVIKTVITYPLNGSTRDFQIPFEYLARKFVQVTLIGRDRKSLVNIQDYRFTSKTQITTNKTWGVGDGYELIELRRFTSATDRLVDFADGSILRAYDLNVSQIQTLHVAEEARDLTADTIGVNNEGHLDARGRRIVNVGDPVNALDAVNLKTIKEWNDGAYQSYVKAKAEAEKATRSATAAKTSETNAYSHMTQAGISEQRSKASETAAENSKNAAASSANSAAQSAGSASNSAQEATGAKEYTKQQADRSYNEAERAKGYADSMGNAIDIGKVIENFDGNFVRWKGNHEFSQYVGVRDQYPNPTVGIQFEAPKGNVVPVIATMTNGNQWRYYGFNPDYAGTLATQNWTNTLVAQSEGGGSQLQSGGNQVIAANPNGNAGFWHTTDRRWTFRVGPDNVAYTSVRNIEVTAPNGYSGIKLVGTGGWHAHLETDGSNTGSSYLVTRSANGSNMYHVVFPQEKYGVLATQQWVSANFSNGTKLGGVVVGNAIRLGGDSGQLLMSGFEAMMSQVPGNAVFCGVAFSDIGSYRAGAPKWRVVS